MQKGCGGLCWKWKANETQVLVSWTLDDEKLGKKTRLVKRQNAVGLLFTMDTAKIEHKRGCNILATSSEPLRFSLKKTEISGRQVLVKCIRIWNGSLNYEKNGVDVMIGKDMYSCILPMAFKENFKGLVVGVVLHIDF